MRRRRDRIIFTQKLRFHISVYAVSIIAGNASEADETENDSDDGICEKKLIDQLTRNRSIYQAQSSRKLKRFKSQSTGDKICDIMITSSEAEEGRLKKTQNLEERKIAQREKGLASSDSN